MKTLTLILLAAFLVPAGAQQLSRRDAAALAFLKEKSPGVHAEIRLLRHESIADYRSALKDASVAAEEYRRLEAAGDTKTAAARLRMYEIDFEAIGVADEIVRSKDEAEIKRLTEKLNGLIGASFDQWVIVEAARIKRLEKSLAALKADYSTTVTNRDATIRSDVRTLIEESRAYQESKKKRKR